jgi:hypothetical protein
VNRQDYKEAAEKLLKKAESDIDGGYTNPKFEAYTSIARVYAMLAALPEERGHPDVPQRPIGPGVSDRIDG